jgi:hypothetical protein
VCFGDLLGLYSSGFQGKFHVPGSPDGDFPSVWACSCVPSRFKTFVIVLGTVWALLQEFLGSRALPLVHQGADRRYNLSEASGSSTFQEGGSKAQQANLAPTFRGVAPSPTEDRTDAQAQQRLPTALPSGRESLRQPTGQTNLHVVKA